MDYMYIHVVHDFISAWVFHLLLIILWWFFQIVSILEIQTQVQNGWLESRGKKNMVIHEKVNEKFPGVCLILIKRQQFALTTHPDIKAISL